ncbi:hypothetical protein EW146_g580 [Bondarzewia mesenterica]|uniref:Uncharacterized protein n=1 Tax=Bondarzewia mesenterica TaxID=1095465 RepID=A0A4S4M7Y3_9AGAM|nr:hypothetical protein EW146_g580 [Bondarzewia mesenterica]
MNTLAPCTANHATVTVSGNLEISQIVVIPKMPGPVTLTFVQTEHLLADAGPLLEVSEVPWEHKLIKQEPDLSGGSTESLTFSVTAAPDNHATTTTISETPISNDASSSRVLCPSLSPAAPADLEELGNTDFDDSGFFDDSAGPLAASDPGSPTSDNGSPELNTFHESITMPSSLEPRDGSDDEASDDEGCKTAVLALDEPPAIRLAYLQAVLGNICDGRTVLDADQFFQRIPICSSCFKIYTIDDIQSFDSPSCTVPRCRGIVYWEKRTSAAVNSQSNVLTTVKHIPAKILPYCGLLNFVHRAMQWPDFIANFIENLEDSDHQPPEGQTEMQDMCDGKAWGEKEIGIHRTVDEFETVTDIEIALRSRKRLVSCKIGLNTTLNIDWFRITDGRPHSAGGVYVSFNNLKCSVRFLQHNVHLAMTIPGPKEPSLEQLNHCLQPLADEFGELVKGVKMCVFNIEWPLPIHGAAGHSHGRHPCNLCDITQVAINTLKAYEYKDFVMRNDWDLLMHAWKARSASSKIAHEAILKEHGIRWSALNEISSWMPATCSPVDFMHNFYLGIVKHFHDLLAPGHLLDATGWNFYQESMNSIIWPSGISCLPTNMSVSFSRTLLTYQKPGSSSGKTTLCRKLINGGARSPSSPLSSGYAGASANPIQSIHNHLNMHRRSCPSIGFVTEQKCIDLSSWMTLTVPSSISHFSAKVASD